MIFGFPKGTAFLVLFLGSLHLTMAQQVSGSYQGSRVKPHTVPIIRVSLAGIDGGKIPLKESKGFLDSLLRAKDQFGRSYRVLSFDFGYLQTDTTYNDTTGMPSLIHEYLAFHFRSAGLDSLWRTRIREELQPGEQLYFDHIITENPLGFRYYGRPLHIQIGNQ